jgi:hypothetical protein
VNGSQGNEFPLGRESSGGYPDPIPPGYGSPAQGAAAGPDGSGDWFSPRREPGGGSASGANDVPEWFTPREPDPPAAQPPPVQYGGGGFSGASDAGGGGSYGSGAGGFSGSADLGGYRAGSSAESGPYNPYESQGNPSVPGGPRDPGGSGGFYGGGGGGGGDDWNDEGRSRRKRSKGALIGPLAGAVGLAVLLGVGVYAFAANAGGCGGGNAITLNVAASPDIADAVHKSAEDFNGQKQSVNGKCVRVEVKNVDPAAVTTLLSGQGVSEGQAQQPDVWIPDSSLWTDLVEKSQKGKGKVRITKTQIAQTPLVVAMPATLAAGLKKAGIISTPSWDNLLTAAGGMPGGAVTKNQTIPADKIRLSVPDPTRNASGMAALMMLRTLLQSDPNANTIFTGIVRTVQHATTTNVEAQYKSLKPDARGRFPVLLTPEQAVWKYNQSKPAEPAVAIYPVEGTATLDYPYTVTTSSDDKVSASQLFEKSLSTANAQSRVQALGFRTPDGKGSSSFGTATGVSPRKPRPLPAPDADSVAQVMQAWSKLSLTIRMLSIIDISGSMADKVPGTNVTRMQATAKTAAGGLQLMTDDTELGQWVFSTNLVGNQPWKEIVPIGPLGDRIGSLSRRQLILGQLAKVKPIPTGNTGLYDTILAAYQKLKATYKPDMINSMLLLTDGKNDDPKGTTLNKLLAALKKEYDPKHPVQVLMIGFGKGVDRSELDQVAQVTDGAVFIANTPAEIQKIFLEAIARRVCAPKCKKN